MKVLELFAGTRSIGKAFEARGAKTGTQGLKLKKRPLQDTCGIM